MTIKKLSTGLQIRLKKIKTKIRVGASPRHVPAKIIVVNDIPRTISGKIVEVAVNVSKGVTWKANSINYKQNKMRDGTDNVVSLISPDENVMVRVRAMKASSGLMPLWWDQKLQRHQWTHS